MLKYYSADYVFPVNELPIRRGVVAVDSDGVIDAVYSGDEAFSLGDVEIERYPGMLIPGFINTHCHLELSHLKDRIKPKGGLVDFIKNVIKSRTAEPKEITKAMLQADKLMYKNGIQAVGDHVNTAVSAKVKEDSNILYHTFVEIIGLKDDEACKKIDEARDIEFFFDPDHASITPHAPYSVSKTAFKIFKKSVSEDNIISIHNQESDEENKLFRYKRGEFLDFYDFMGLDYSEFKAQARNSLQSYLSYLPISNKVILVHNTFTSIKDIDFINRLGRNVVFCLCPKANLYIEDRLPRINLFDWNSDNLVLGTDSLASNDTLDMLEEMKTLHAHFPDLDLLKTIKWATLNGAKALGVDDQLGSLEVGKAPGLILLKNMKNFRLHDDVRVQRIV
jgi:cytosine/adenosine deaminase-related metal-dependent hydrolase